MTSCEEIPDFVVELIAAGGDSPELPHAEGSRH
jgi:hypothetical protein